VYELNGLQIRIQRLKIHKDRWVWSKVQTTFFFMCRCNVTCMCVYVCIVEMEERRDYISRRVA